MSVLARLVTGPLFFSSPATSTDRATSDIVQPAAAARRRIIARWAVVSLIVSRVCFVGLSTRIIAHRQIDNKKAHATGQCRFVSTWSDMPLNE